MRESKLLEKSKTFFGHWSKGMNTKPSALPIKIFQLVKRNIFVKIMFKTKLVNTSTFETVNLYK